MNPTLTVDGDPWDWTGDDIFDPSRNTVRIDGNLPTVTDIEAGGGLDVFGLVRALRVGDKVTLAYIDQEMIAVDCRVPFATATVAHIQPAYDSDGSTVGHGLTVTDVEALR